MPATATKRRTGLYAKLPTGSKIDPALLAVPIAEVTPAHHDGWYVVWGDGTPGGSLDYYAEVRQALEGFLYDTQYAWLVPGRVWWLHWTAAKHLAAHLPPLAEALPDSHSAAMREHLRHWQPYASKRTLAPSQPRTDGIPTPPDRGA